MTTVISEGTWWGRVARLSVIWRFSRKPPILGLRISVNLRYLANSLIKSRLFLSSSTKTSAPSLELLATMVSHKNMLAARRVNAPQTLIDVRNRCHTEQQYRETRKDCQVWKICFTMHSATMSSSLSWVLTRGRQSKKEPWAWLTRRLSSSHTLSKSWHSL